VKATNDSITPDRWFKTRDIATVDNEGYCYIIDRKKEFIKYKGFQGTYLLLSHQLLMAALLIGTLRLIVPPAELESVLLQHPDMADVAIIGIESKEEATELPRFVTATFFFANQHFAHHLGSVTSRAYVVHANPTSLNSDADRVVFRKSAQEWIKNKVDRHKFLRGGKFSSCLRMIFRTGLLNAACRCCSSRYHSEKVRPLTGRPNGSLGCH
jgi:acyl-CoA synthetase (AMP-forming)/AMP-acid ligase II